MIFYSSPYELIDMLKSIDNVLGDRKTAVSKEITKLHETTYRGTPNELINMLSDMEIKGEFVIVTEGNKEEKKLLTREEAKEIFDMEVEKGEHPKELIKKLAKENNLNKRDLYNYLMKK